MSLDTTTLAHAVLDALEEMAGLCDDLLSVDTGFMYDAPEENHQHPLLSGEARKALSDRRGRLTLHCVRLRRVLGLPRADTIREAALAYSTTGEAALANAHHDHAFGESA